MDAKNSFTDACLECLCQAPGHHCWPTVKCVQGPAPWIMQRDRGSVGAHTLRTSPSNARTVREVYVCVTELCARHSVCAIFYLQQSPPENAGCRAPKSHTLSFSQQPTHRRSLFIRFTFCDLLFIVFSALSVISRNIMQEEQKKFCSGGSEVMQPVTHSDNFMPQKGTCHNTSSRHRHTHTPTSSKRHVLSHCAFGGARANFYSLSQRRAKLMSSVCNGMTRRFAYYFSTPLRLSQRVYISKTIFTRNFAIYCQRNVIGSVNVPSVRRAQINASGVASEILPGTWVWQEITFNI